MNVIGIDVDRARAQVDLSHDELRIISNALNEIVNGVEIPHFETRIGAKPNDVRELLAAVRALLRNYALPDW